MIKSKDWPDDKIVERRRKARNFAVTEARKISDNSQNRSKIYIKHRKSGINCVQDISNCLQ